MRAASHFFGRAAPHTAAVLHSIFLGDVVDGSIFVLFVDDDTAFANAAAHSFQSVGMQTLLLLGSGVGIDVFDNSIDVIITDIDLPARKPQGRRARLPKNRSPASALRFWHGALHIDRWYVDPGACRRPEHPGSPFLKLRLPLRDLVGVNVEVLRQLSHRVLAPDGSQRHLRLECRCVVPARASDHCVS
jgi:hypothetical protein